VPQQPCTNCPEPESLPHGLYNILYMGGPAVAQYLMLRRAIPAHDQNVIRQYGWPTITDNGWLQYSEGQEPPIPEGWETAGPRIFKPIWPPCKSRMLKATVLDNGVLRVEAVCLHPATGRAFNETITLAACQECPHRRPIP
jgi:hypothetical protein